jgi:hypothetical protein
MRIINSLFVCLLATATQAQEVDLFTTELTEDSAQAAKQVNYTIATFKSTRLINGQSIENTHKGSFDFLIQHRFGTLNSGFNNLFGLDNASFRMGFDFGITDQLMVGLGRSTFEKQYDAFVKYKLLRQSTGARNMPVSVSANISFMAKTLQFPDTIQRSTSERLSYAFEALIARKFNQNLSIQLMPGLLHYNIVPKASNDNDIFYLGAGGRLKLSKRVSINTEYYHVFNPLDGYYNSLSFGFDIETGGHVFQLHLTNSTGMTQRTFITETTGRWGKGDIHFGFNIHRTFSLKKNKTRTAYK